MTPETTSNPTKVYTTHTQVAILIFELVKPKTVTELAFYTDLGERTVERYLAELRFKRLVYIADWQYRSKFGRYFPRYAIDLTGKKKDANPPQV